ncbi:MAG: type II secretion system F family protein [Candidatus Omnitrophica bacterium]|nr:type II secretion system F family protein [Candidatus Omnitrophota bacterium]
MTLYRYRAKNGTEGIIEGKIEANSEKDAIEKLSQMGYLPLKVKADFESDKPSETKHKEIRGRIKFNQVTIITRQLASLLKSGLPILKSLDILKEQSENTKLKKILDDIYDVIRNGESFSFALAKYPKIFSTLYVGMINVGENSGNLPKVLLSISEYRTKQEALISRLRMALVYPLIVALLGVATVIFMLTFVIPRLAHIFNDSSQSLPIPTQIIMSISHGLRQWWYWIILGLVISISLIKKFLKTDKGKLFLSKLKINLPLLGKLFIKAELLSFCATLELLIKGGIPILKALNVAIPVLSNQLIKNQLRISYKELEQGGSFGVSLKKSKLFPIFMSNLILIGEESGKLDESLGEVAVNYERDTDEMVKVISTMIEPIIIVVMGVVVGFIVMAMLLPIFEINL